MGLEVATFCLSLGAQAAEDDRDPAATWQLDRLSVYAGVGTAGAGAQRIAIATRRAVMEQLRTRGVRVRIRKSGFGRSLGWPWPRDRGACVAGWCDDPWLPARYTRRPGEEWQSIISRRPYAWRGVLAITVVLPNCGREGAAPDGLARIEVTSIPCAGNRPGVASRGKLSIRQAESFCEVGTASARGGILGTAITDVAMAPITCPEDYPW